MKEKEISCSRAEAHKNATIHVHEVATKHEFSMLTVLGSLKIQSKCQILSGKFLILSTADTKLHSTCGRGMQKQSAVAWNCASLFTGTKSHIVFFCSLAWTSLVYNWVIKNTILMSISRLTSVFLTAVKEKLLKLHLLIFQDPNVTVKKSLAAESQIKMQML